MGFLFIIWVLIRNILDSAMEATSIWGIARQFTDFEWVGPFWLLFWVHMVTSFPKVWKGGGSVSLAIDFGLFVGSVVSGSMTSLLLTIIVGGAIWLTRSWTGLEPNWLVLWLTLFGISAVSWRISPYRRLAEARLHYRFRAH